MYLTITILLAVAAIVLSFLARWESAVCALAALALAVITKIAYPDYTQLIFWGVATLIALGITALLPEPVRRARTGMPFFAIGGLAGLALGMMANTLAGIIVGAAAGLAIGAIVLGRQPAGSQLGFPSKQYYNYALAKCLPLLVTYSMIGIVVLNILSTHH